jgi:hypothetical protein
MILSRFSVTQHNQLFATTTLATKTTTKTTTNELTMMPGTRLNWSVSKKDCYEHINF